MKTKEALEEAVENVRNGATVAEAAKAAGLTWANVHTACVLLNVRPPARHGRLRTGVTESIRATSAENAKSRRLGLSVAHLGNPSRVIVDTSVPEVISVRALPPSDDGAA